jgi:hypothetical protein
MNVKRIIAALFIAAFVGVVLMASEGKVYTVFDKAVKLTLTDTVSGIDTGRIATFDSTTAARTLVKVKAGIGDTSHPWWRVFKPKLSIVVESTGKGPFTFTIDSLSGQFPDSGFRFAYTKTAYTGTRQSGFVNWKYTIYSDSTGFQYPAITTAGCGDETIKRDTGDIIIIPPARLYQIKFKCWRMTNLDSTGAYMILQTKVSGNDKSSAWVAVCSTSFFTDTSLVGYWKSYSMQAVAETTLANSGHLGEAFRVIAHAVDSQAAPIYVNQVDWFGLSCQIIARY